MTQDSLYEQCLQAVHSLAQQWGWQLSTDGVVALAEAILPYVVNEPEIDTNILQTIAINYYHDGPMVQGMLDPNSAQGEQLWGEWRSYMLKVARSKGLIEDEAVDLVQALYVQVQRALPRFEYRSRLKTYFYKIFNNHYIRWLQKQERIQELPTADRDEYITKTEVIAAPDQEVIQNELRRLVREEVQKMISSENYHILYLYYVEQTYLDSETNTVHKWTDKAIGEALDLPLNTITTRRTRSLRHLRQHPHLAKLFQEMLGTTVTYET